jgi:hypothetical protein
MARSPWRLTALRERAKENTTAKASPRTKALQRAKLEENRREKMEKVRFRKVTKKDQREEELANNPRAKEKERSNVMFVAIQDTMHGIAGNRFEMCLQMVDKDLRCRDLLRHQQVACRACHTLSLCLSQAILLRPPNIVLQESWKLVMMLNMMNWFSTYVVQGLHISVAMSMPCISSLVTVMMIFRAWDISEQSLTR